MLATEASREVGLRVPCQSLYRPRFVNTPRKQRLLEDERERIALGDLIPKLSRAGDEADGGDVVMTVVVTNFR